jgi:gas vesicle protein
MDKKSKDVLIGAGVGVLGGGIAGILLAPKSGKETRDDITGYIHEMKDKIAAELEKAGKVSKETYNAIVEKVVKVYELEKKISPKDAKAIKDRLDKNFAKVKEVIKK